MTVRDRLALNLVVRTPWSIESVRNSSVEFPRWGHRNSRCGTAVRFINWVATQARNSKIRFVRKLGFRVGDVSCNQPCGRDRAKSYPPRTHTNQLIVEVNECIVCQKSSVMGLIGGVQGHKHEGRSPRFLDGHTVVAHVSGKLSLDLFCRIWVKIRSVFGSVFTSKLTNIRMVPLLALTEYM